VFENLKLRNAVSGGEEMLRLRSYEKLQNLVNRGLVEKMGKDLVVVGLDGDAHRKPFGKILDLIPLADTVQRLHALCKLCGDGSVARFTCPVTSDSSEATKSGLPNVGGSDSYIPLCRKHYLAGYN
jgi:thymidine kinase